MRTEPVTLRFEQEKLKALQFYASKKGNGLEADLTAYMEKLYQRYVPTAAKDYIEMLSQEPTQLQRASRRARPEQLATDTVDEE